MREERGHDPDPGGGKQDIAHRDVEPRTVEVRTQNRRTRHQTRKRRAEIAQERLFAPLQARGRDGGAGRADDLVRAYPFDPAAQAAIRCRRNGEEKGEKRAADEQKPGGRGGEKGGRADHGVPIIAAMSARSRP